ncbi:MAG TPA: cytochrome c3 family protein [Terriglobales bacterium]|nr:cytochrome c3 family protein [Terriglobales bacterium]
MKILTTLSEAATFVHHYCPETWVSTLPQFASRAQNRNPGLPWSQSSPLVGPLMRIVLGLSLAVIGLPRAWSAVHPIPLDPKTDSAKCLECHEDKTKGKAVHSAIALGCQSCHEIRVNKDITRVKLITATPYKLCLTCHSDKDAAQIKGNIHKPVALGCLSCHDPHTTDNKNQLLKATSGEKKDNLCLTCHTQGMNVPEKGSRHAALDMGCDTCHTTHKTSSEPAPQNQFHLTKATPALCVDCHDPKDANLQKAHQNQPFGSANCLSCHDPHQSAAPKLMAKFQHPPFADKSCEMCHAPAKDGKVVLAQANVKDLCVTCHDDKAKLIESAKVQHPGAAGDCTDCHNPHASREPGLPKTDSVSICIACHTDIGELGKKKVHHQPAFVQGCATCHEPHGGANKKLLRAATPNALCLECHSVDSKPAKVENSDLLTIFSGKVRLPGNYFTKNKVVRLQIKSGQGHPTPSHPVQDVMDPTDFTKVKTQVSCLICHQPHAAAGRGMLVGDVNPGMAFCQNCHKGMVGVGN